MTGEYLLSILIYYNTNKGVNEMPETLKQYLNIHCTILEYAKLLAKGTQYSKILHYFATQDAHLFSHNLINKTIWLMFI